MVLSEGIESFCLDLELKPEEFKVITGCSFHLESIGCPETMKNTGRSCYLFFAGARSCLEVWGREDVSLLPDGIFQVRVGNSSPILASTSRTHELLHLFSGAAGPSGPTRCGASSLAFPRPWRRSGRTRPPSRTSTASPSGSGWKEGRRRCPSIWRSASGSWSFPTTSHPYCPAGSDFCRYSKYSKANRN